MKKLVLLLASLFLLGGCTQEFVRESTYTPTGGADYNPALDPDLKPSGDDSGDQGGGDQGGGSGGGGQGGDVTPDDEGEEELMCTYSIYFSYSHTTKYNADTKKDEDSPILSFEAPMLKPYGKVPDELAENGVLSETKVRALGTAQGYTVDPAFPTFKGFSFHGLCLDDSDLWDFTKDYKQLAVVTLYGVWYSDQLL